MKVQTSLDRQAAENSVGVLTGLEPTQFIEACSRFFQHLLVKRQPPRVDYVGPLVVNGH